MGALNVVVDVAVTFEGCLGSGAAAVVGIQGRITVAGGTIALGAIEDIVYLLFARAQKSVAFLVVIRQE